jgi:hypothetical protein
MALVPLSSNALWKGQRREEQAQLAQAAHVMWHVLEGRCWQVSQGRSCHVYQ